MVLKSKYDEAIQREESLEAEQEAGRQFLATQRDDFEWAQSSQRRFKADQLFIDALWLQIKNQEDSSKWENFVDWGRVQHNPSTEEESNRRSDSLIRTER